MSKTQREYVLREQLRAIQRELREEHHQSRELAQLRKAIYDAGLPPQARAEASVSCTSWSNFQLYRLSTVSYAPTSISLPRCPGARLPAPRSIFRTQSEFCTSTISILKR